MTSLEEFSCQYYWTWPQSSNKCGIVSEFAQTFTVEVELRWVMACAKTNKKARMFVWPILGLTLYLHLIIGLCWATKCSFSPLTPVCWDDTGSGNTRRLALAHTQLWELPKISLWNGRCQLDAWDWHRILLAHVARCWKQGFIWCVKVKLCPLQPRCQMDRVGVSFILVMHDGVWVCLFNIECTVILSWTILQIVVRN